LNEAGVTVAVASCGRPAALARCLAALEGGAAAPGEVLVVDQAPSDEARRVVSAFADGSARYLEQERRGLSASRNLALASASRPILAVTDDDCAPEPGWVTAIARAFADGNRLAAVTGPIAPLGPQPQGTHPVSLRQSAAAAEHRWPAIPWMVGSGANFAAPCSVLRANAGWDERLGVGSPGQAAEDADLIYRILKSGGVVRYEPAAVVQHEWQTLARRLATRRSYGYGVGALCGLWLRRGDLYALRMLASYTRLQLVRLAAAARRGDRDEMTQFRLALAGLAPGLAYGLRAAASPRRAPVEVA
jgi:glycosyltransferase involved in cell wall biosynthesis